MRDNYAHCQAQVREHDKDRFLATLFARAVARPHLFALYAFDLELARVRDRAKGAAAGEIRLQWWREVMEGGRGEEATGHPVAAALLDTLARCSLQRNLLVGLIEARIFDLYDDPMPSLAALNAYADKSSGALIELAASVLTGGAITRGGTIPAGRALAWTALLRQLSSHAARGQVYVPADLLARHGANRDAAISGRATPEFFAALAELRALARRELEAARAQSRNVSPEAAPAFLPLALVPLYLARMERRGYDPFRTPIEVPQWRRQWALWRAARRGV
jgi:phytoene synthase